MRIAYLGALALVSAGCNAILGIDDLHLRGDDVSDAPPGTVDSPPGADGPRQIDAGPLPPDSPSGVPAIRINLAGTAYTGIEYPGEWAADPGGLCNGTASQAAGDVHNTVDDTLFLPHYTAVTACSFGTALPDGMYRVRVLLAETTRGAGCSGATRIYDMAIEGVPVLTAYDLTVDCEGCTTSTTLLTAHPVVKEFDVAVTGGTVDLTMTPNPDPPYMNAIEILPLF